MKDEYMAMAEMLIAKRECEEAGKKLPPIRAERAITESNDLPSLPPEIIEGIIRKGGKPLVAGASKAGKSYLLIELAIAVATGGWWLDFRCAKGRVLYVNLEIQKPQFMHRVYNVAKAVGVSRTTVHENMMVANLRGKYSDITSLVDDLINSYEPGVFDLVIIDPAYKVQPGSENDANAITRFCAELDRLVEAIDCTIAYSHHHSKGSQGGKNAQDRASGSGVRASIGRSFSNPPMTPGLSTSMLYTICLDKWKMLILNQSSLCFLTARLFRSNTETLKM